jgi:hypothetical protein
VAGRKTVFVAITPSSVPADEVGIQIGGFRLAAVRNDVVGSGINPTARRAGGKMHTSYGKQGDTIAL